MTDTLQPVKHVTVLEPDGLRLVRIDPPSVSARHWIDLDRMWTEAVQTDPYLYDGPCIAVSALEQSPGELVLKWAPVTYRYFMLRHLDVHCLPCLFSAVIQPTDTGGMLVGRSSSSTKKPGRVHLPGGVAEPPTSHDIDLDTLHLAREATRELAEETGITVPKENLTFMLVTHAVNGNVGVIFRAPPLQESVVRQQFDEHHTREAAAGRAVEFDEIDIVSTVDDLAAMGGPYTDSVISVVRHFESI